MEHSRSREGSVSKEHSKESSKIGNVRRMSLNGPAGTFGDKFLPDLRLSYNLWRLLVVKMRPFASDRERGPFCIDLCEGADIAHMFRKICGFSCLKHLFFASPKMNCAIVQVSLCARTGMLIRKNDHNDVGVYPSDHL